MSVLAARRHSTRSPRSLVVFALAVTALAVATLAVAALAVPAAASATPLDLRQPIAAAGSARGLAPTPGVRAQSPSAGARASVLAQLTGGLSASEVTPQSTCSAPAPGSVTCTGETLALRSTGKRIHPRVAGARTFTQVFPSVRRGVAPTAGSGSQPAPSAGTPAWLQQAYDLTYLSQTAGAGDTVAIVDAYDDPTAEADLAIYRAKYGLPRVHDRQRLLHEGQRERRHAPLPAQGLGLGGRDLARPRRRLRDVPELPHPARRGELDAYDSDLNAAEHPRQRRPGAKQISNSWARLLERRR